MRKRLAERWLLCAILLLAFSLRVYHLDFQSLWSDEGISLVRSGQPLGQMLEKMPVEHMPGYFVLLHFWLQIAGKHDFATRFLSLWPSVLSVALLYRLGIELASPPPSALAGSFPLLSTCGEERDAGGDEARFAERLPSWFGRLASIGGALLLATAAFQVWYAQEVRMYGWLLAAGLGSILFFWRLLFAPNTQRSQLVDWCGYVGATTLVVYLHFYGFLVPLVHTCLALIWLVTTHRWRRFFAWAAADVLIFLLFLPWLPRALQIFAFDGWRADGDPWSIPWRYLVAYTLGDSMPDGWLRDWLPWGYLLLAVAGVIGWWRQRTAALFLLAHLLLPLLIIFFLALRNPDFHERYALLLTVPLSLLVGGGIALIGGYFGKRLIIPAIVLSLLIAANGVALERLYWDTSIHKPDFRGAAWAIAHNERPGDVVLVDGPDPEKVFLHYYRDMYKGTSPVHDLRPLIDADGDEIVQTLTAATDGAPRAWELLYFHGPGAVQHWLALTGWATAPSYHNNVRVTLYGRADGEDASAMETEDLNALFGPPLQLTHVEHNATTFAPGELLRLSTHWQVLEPAPDYKFSLRLLGEGGGVLIARDYFPHNWFSHTSNWAVGESQVDQHGLIIPADLAPGNYQIALRLYDPTNGVPVEATAGETVGEEILGHDVPLMEIVVVDGPGR